MSLKQQNYNVFYFVAEIFLYGEKKDILDAIKLWADVVNMDLQENYRKTPMASSAVKSTIEKALYKWVSNWLFKKIYGVKGISPIFMDYHESYKRKYCPFTPSDLASLMARRSNSIIRDLIGKKKFKNSRASRVQQEVNNTSVPFFEEEDRDFRLIDNSFNVEETVVNKLTLQRLMPYLMVAILKANETFDTIEPETKEEANYA